MTTEEFAIMVKVAIARRYWSDGVILCSGNNFEGVLTDDFVKGTISQKGITFILYNGRTELCFKCPSTELYTPDVLTLKCDSIFATGRLETIKVISRKEEIQEVKRRIEQYRR